MNLPQTFAMSSIDRFILSENYLVLQSNKYVALAILELIAM